jgi:hypothetical protein
MKLSIKGINNISSLINSNDISITILNSIVINGNALPSNTIKILANSFNPTRPQINLLTLFKNMA